MKEITILSGKGGTGKTSIAAAIASLSSGTVFCDNDVDASNLHLIMKPETTQEFSFSGGDTAVIEQEKCTGCELCINVCRFDAIRKGSNGLPLINPFSCEGCQLCSRLCPQHAIRIVHHQNNRWYISDTRFGKLIHARMGAGEENSGKLVTRLRETAKTIAAEKRFDLIISDSPPGIGCPVIASLTGTGAVLLVTEPSLSGFHDAVRLFELGLSFNIPHYVVINKYDLNPEMTARVEQFFKGKNVPVLGKIPFDARLVKAMLNGMSIIEYAPQSIISREISEIWKKLLQLIDTRDVIYQE